MTPHRVTYRAEADGFVTVITAVWQSRYQAEQHATQLREIPNICNVRVDPELIEIIAEFMTMRSSSGGSLRDILA